MTSGLHVAAPHGATRPAWRSVAIPNEHGGWGLTLEPVVLGLVISPSAAGVCLGVAAVLAFLVRTPIKLIAIDLRHHRWIDRSRLASRLAAVELAVIGLLASAALVLAGWGWTVPVAVAIPFVALEWWYDSRGRGRRLVPEVSGAFGIAAVVAAVVLAGDGPASLAAASWLLLAARSVGSIPFVRVQIARLRRGSDEVWPSDLAQVFALVGAAGSVAADGRFVAGSLAVAVIVVLQLWWVRRPPVPPKRLGFTQLALGIGLVAVSGLGVLTA